MKDKLTQKKGAAAELSRPILVAIDIQREYMTPGRSFYLNTASTSLENARRVLQYARRRGWSIIHVRHLQQGDIFNPESEYSSFVAGFEPLANEVEIIKGNFSCYSSSQFTKLMGQHIDRQVYIIGYGSTMCCLSTVIDGYHRGQKLTFISDASCARRTAHFDEQSTHAYATDILSTFATIVKTREVVGE